MSARAGAGSRSPFVAILHRRGRFLVAEPFFERGPRFTVDPRIGGTARRGGGPGRGGKAGSKGGHARARGRGGGRNVEARPGDLVLIETSVGRRAETRGAGRLLRVLGRPGVARDVLEALMLDRGLRRRFDPAVERDARLAGAAGDGGAPRRDLRGLPTFTIDPVDARDFDDAVSAERSPGGGIRVWIHIADVSAFVAAGSPTDREAHRRATSVYVPGAVEPMLPEALSNDVCSLVPGRDRPTVTVELELEGARVRRRAFYRSLIRSDARLDYEQVDRVFDGSESAAEPWGAPLDAARAAAAALGAERARRGALVVATAEPEFAFDEAGGVESVTQTEQTESHAVIEQLMVAANEQVAGLLSERGIPALYRVHARPDAARIAHLAEALATLGVPTPPLPERLSPQQAADAVGEISAHVDAHVRRTRRGRAALTSLVLRSLERAYYSPRNLGHAGLRSLRYCHFTSPIRRYPDLVCHRALLSALEGSQPAPPAAELEGTATWTSAREREAMSIERDADDVARCFLLERHLRGDPDPGFDGEVVGMVPAGMFVSFGAEGFEGMLPVRRLRGDWWELNEQGTIMRAADSGRAIRLGDPVRVIVDRVDAPRGRVDLLPAEGPVGSG